MARRFPGHEALLTAFLSNAEHVVLPWKEIEESVSLHEKKVRDAKDAPVLAAVVLARPDFAVTGDVGLREDMKRCQDTARVTSICSSRQFLREVLKKQR